MPILSLEEVSALKIQLENHRPDSELYASPLDKAILHLLTAAELGVLKGERLRSLPGAQLAGRREEEEEEAYLEDCLNFDALGLAIDWIHQKCRPNASKQTVRSIDEGTLVGAKKLLSVAARLALFSNYLNHSIYE